jgi:hypothetical protein
VLRAGRGAAPRALLLLLFCQCGGSIVVFLTLV